MGVVLPAAHEVVGCSLSDAPPQSDHRGVLDYQGLDRCGGGGYLGIPEGYKSSVSIYHYKVIVHLVSTTDSI